MAEHTVRVCGFRYTDHNDIERVAHSGEVIDFSDEDTARGLEAGAFVAAAAPEATSAIGPNSTDEELEAFVKDAKVSEVVDAANGDGAFAQRLLAAENAATGNDARPTVAKGLAAVVGEGGGSSTSTTSTEPKSQAPKEAPTSDTTSREPVDYTTWKGPELNAELEKRGIEFKPVGEKNSAKAEKLAADDAKGS
jgi:hypothetical protein